MKKNLLLALAIVSLFVITSCGDDESPDPIIGLWELDDVSYDAEGSEFDYLDVSGLNNLAGEALHTIEFNTDLTYVRTLTGVNFSDGTSGNIEDSGEWSLNGSSLQLDSDQVEIGGIPYDMTVISISNTDLVLGYVDNSRAFFPQSKIDEWFADGTIDANGFFTVPDAEVDSIIANFQEIVPLNYTLEFEK